MSVSIFSSRVAYLRQQNLLGAQYPTCIFQTMSGFLGSPKTWTCGIPSEFWTYAFLLHLHKMLSPRLAVYIVINRVKYYLFSVCASTCFLHIYKILLNLGCLAHMATFPCQKNFWPSSDFMGNFYLNIKSKYLLLQFFYQLEIGGKIAMHLV